MNTGHSHGYADAPGTGSMDRLMHHRFGVNYVPSHNWYYCWNDWHADHIARDFDRVAEIGADHMRIMLVWPWFQPNPRVVSTEHLDRLEELLKLAAERNLDVLVTLYTGWLSGYSFVPLTPKEDCLAAEDFYASPKWQAMQQLYLNEVAKRVVMHKNFMGFDLGNEINCCWSGEPKNGDLWMEGILGRMHELCPGRTHVNGVDHSPWFSINTFSPEVLVARQEIVALHAWAFWTGAGEYGKPLDKPYTHLPAAMAALARSIGRSPRKPIWLQEFGVCNIEMTDVDVSRWMELSVQRGVEEGISYFTWWASHDIDSKFEFHPFEYDLGLVTSGNEIKERARTFKRLAEAYRGKPVIIPDKPLPPPPTERSHEATWKWLLAWMDHPN